MQAVEPAVRRPAPQQRAATRSADSVCHPAAWPVTPAASGDTMPTLCQTPPQKPAVRSRPPGSGAERDGASAYRLCWCCIYGALLATLGYQLYQAGTR